jgi:hypothetical protein
MSMFLLIASFYWLGFGLLAFTVALARGCGNGLSPQWTPPLELGCRSVAPRWPQRVPLQAQIPARFARGDTHCNPP